MKYKLGFTLIEIIVVITIMSLVLSVGVFKFFSFVDSQELSDKIYLLERELIELDSAVNSYSISDYETHIKPGLGYYYYTNYFDNDKKQIISIDFDTLTGVITNNLSSYVYLNILNDLSSKIYNVSTGSSFSGLFYDSLNYKITATNSGDVLNDIIINSFGEENLGFPKDQDNILKLDEINSKEDKTGTNFSELVIKNTGKGRVIYGDGTQLQQAYLFFSKKGKESVLKIE